MLAAPSNLMAQGSRPPVCDTDCNNNPDPGSASVQVSIDRAQPINQRGIASIFSAAATTGGTTTVQGSSSYTYKIPMYSLPGRAGLDLNLSLFYNSHIWLPDAQGGMLLGFDRDTPSPGFQLNFGFLEWNPSPNGPSGILTTADGAKHTLSVNISNLVPNAPPPNNTSYSCANQICLYDSDDSSYINVSRPLGTFSGATCSGTTNCPAKDSTVTYKNGTRAVYQSFAVVTNDIFDEFVMRPYLIEDTNGNTINIAYTNPNDLAISSITDSLGRTLNFFYNNVGGGTCGGGGACTTGALLACVTDGASCTAPGARTYTFAWDPAHAIPFNFTLAGQALIGGNLQAVTSGFTLSLITKVCRPDETCVKFNYGDFGIVNDIQELSADGSTPRYEVNYDFPTAAAGSLSLNPTFTHQVETVNGKTNTWTFSSTLNASGLPISTTIIDPAGVSTTTTYSRKGDWEDGLPIQVQTMSAEQFHTMQLCVPTPCPAPPAPRTRIINWTSDLSEAQSGITAGGTQTGKNPRTASMVTILDDNSQSQVSMQYDNSPTPIAAGAPSPFTGSGSITDKTETDFGAGKPGPIIRETLTGYTSFPNHILGLPTDVKVKDGSGKVVSHAVMSYDGVAVQNVSPLPSGHDNVGYSATSTAARGNLTATTIFADPVNNAGAVTYTYQYDMLGNKIAEQDGCCSTLAWNYSITTQFGYPDSLVQGPAGSQLTTSYTYNMNTGLRSSTTDWNGKVTNYSYDLSGRLISTQGPDNVVISNKYDDLSSNPGINTSSTASTLATNHVTDFNGNSVADEILNGASVVSTVNYINDGVGRPVQISNPYAPGQSAVFTSYAYDLLGRSSSTTPPAIDPGGSQNPYTSSTQGFVTTTTDPAGHSTRKFANALGQIVRVDQPGLLGATAAAASLSVSGSELSVPSSAGVNGATAGTATFTISGAERNTNVLTHAATSASLTVTVGGANSTNVNTSTVCTGGPPSRLPLNCRTFTTNSPDSGTISFTVVAGGVSVGPISVPYNSTSTTAGLAAALFSAFPANSVVNMSNPNGTASFTLTTKATGASTNSSTISTLRASSCVSSDTMFCAGAGWTLTLSGPGLAPNGGSSAAFTGGTDNGFTTHYDTGKVTVGFVANGTTYSKTSSYGQNSTANSIALDLYNQFNGDTTVSQVVRITPPGTGGLALNSIGFTTVATGVGTNYPISVSQGTTDTADFSSGSTSFSVAASGTTFTAGQNGVLFDTGKVTMTISLSPGATPFTKSVTYGQGSNAAGIAAQLASLVHSDPSFPVDATNPPGSATINLTARATGTDANAYSVSLSGTSSAPTSFPTPSFAATAASAQFAGGSTGTASFDPTVVITTTYVFDPFGRLLQAANGQQTRTYAYDGLGRMTSVATPETGNLPVRYTYTDFGAVAQRIDPRVIPGTSNNVTTTFKYDSLNRVQTVTYNDSLTPAVTYTYNPPNSANNTGGRLATVTNGIETKSYQYDVMGRVTQCLETIGANSYAVTYNYGADGQIQSIIYPSQLKVSYSYDPMGRLAGIATPTQSILSINPNDYSAAGVPAHVSYGNGITAKYGYNNQLQLSSIEFDAPNATVPLLSLGYSYGGSSDNGQILGITDGVTSSRSTSYQYDPLGRLQLAQTVDQTSSNTWKLSYAYDRYGNRLSQEPTGGAGTMPASSTPTDPLTNHIIGSGVTYDALGNMLSDGLNYYAFDANGRLVSTSSVPGFGSGAVNLSYGPDGKLVRKGNTVYIYANGRLIAEYANGAAASLPTAEYVNLHDQQLARIVGGVVTLNLRDHLSTRVNTDVAGKPVRTYGSFPFGETAYDTEVTNDFKFTSYRRDPSTGLDDADARFYSSRLGRFISMDAVADDNRYAYVGNDPINKFDPSGMMACTTNPFDHRILPLCGPDQLGSAVGPDDASCGINFDEDGFTVSFASGCTSFSVDFDGGLGGPFGNISNTLQNLLSIIVPIDTCPGGTFECPDDGKPLFGTPDCGPWCVSDLEVLRGKCDESNEGKFGKCDSSAPTAPINWPAFFMKLACWAGVDPDNMAPITPKSEPKDSSDAPEKGTTAGRKRLPGQHKPGGRGAENVNDGVGYLASVLECLHNVNEVLNGQGEKK
jgi:RHS repeat-associated protein